MTLDKEAIVQYNPGNTNTHVLRDVFPGTLEDGMEESRGRLSRRAS